MMAKEERKGLYSALALIFSGASKGRGSVGMRYRKDNRVYTQPLDERISRGSNLITESKVSERRKIEKGIQLLESAPDSTLHDEDAALKYVHLGIAHKKLQDFESSNRCFRKAIEHGHSTGLAYEKLAINLTKQGKLEEAIEVCKSLIDHPTIPKPRSHLTKEMMQKRMEKLQKKLAAEKPKDA